MKMGERIRCLREASGLTQEELGDKLGVQKSAIVKYEKGRVENIKRSTIKTMSEIFGVSPCFLMGFDDDEEQVKHVAEEVTLLQSIQRHWGQGAVKILELYNTLNDDGKKKAVGQLEDLSEILKYRKDDDS